MKKLLHLFIILVLASCNNTTKDISSKRSFITDTVSTTELPQNKITDTLIKISEPFTINNIKCYWKHYISTDNTARIVLKNYKTNQVIIDTDFILFYFTSLKKIMNLHLILKK
ncbi:MAG: hypothetical protein V4572_09915 [Bacteroidota bacterium]